MNEDTDKYPDAPEPKVQDRRPGISLVWFIPLVALILGSWFVYQNWITRGPLITITFDTAAGIESGVTLIKYRDVSIGKVETVEIGSEFENVVVYARLDSKVASYLNDSTQFWIERPRVGTAGITGLGTLFSGAHIGFEASIGEETRHDFVGLERPPLVDTGSDGIRITLHAPRARSLIPGSPVYYKSSRVGTIESVDFDAQFEGLIVKAFVQAPYSTLIHTGSRFWNVSGISAKLNSEGFAVDFESLESLLIGGIEFDSPPRTEKTERSLDEAEFRIYPSFEAIDIVSYAYKLPFVLLFDQSLRGLNPDAQVEYRGLKIGRVVEIRSDYQQGRNKVLLPVLIEIEPERLGIQTNNREQQEVYLSIRDLGLVAKLEFANLLTGQLYVSMDSEAKPVQLSLLPYDGIAQLPTISTDLTKIAANVDAALTKFNQLEIEALIASLADTIKAIKVTVSGVNTFVANTDASVGKALGSLDHTLQTSVQLLESGTEMFQRGQSVMKSLEEGSATRYELDETLEDFQAAARSLKTLIETIERNPNAIIFGKQNRN